MIPLPVDVDLHEMVRRPALLTIPDDPENDHTDYAHPAWWRGNDVGCVMTTLRIKKALDGEDDGSGVIAAPELERVRRRVLCMRYWLTRATEALAPDPVTGVYNSKTDYLNFRYVRERILRILREEG